MQEIQNRLHNIKKNKYLLSVSILLVLLVLLNMIAFNQTFCNRYTETVYGILADFLGRIMNFFPVAIGELLMYIGAFWVFCTVILSILLIFLRKKKDFLQFAKFFYKTVFITFLCALFFYTIHWSIPFRSSLLGENGHFEKQYSIEELRKVWLYVVENLNKTCEQAPRDKNGLLLFDGKEKTEKEVADAMKKLAGRYKRLSGYYPTIKPALCSDVLKWMQIGGYTYPYTMEVTYNQYISDLYFPTLYAHESAHHQGYYQENEANFLSYLGCAGSDNRILRYSAYHEIYYYVNNAYASALSGADVDDSLRVEYKNTVIAEQVRIDEKMERQKVQKNYASNAHPLGQYSDIAQNAADVGWNTQKEILAKNNYDGVVQLLLEYYDGILF